MTTAKSTKSTDQPFDPTILKKNLKIHARSLGIPSGAANDFIDRTIKQVQVSLKSKKLVTNKDITRAVVKELKKYHADFAYVYQNRDKII